EKEKMNTITHNDEDNTKKKNIEDKKKANGDDKVPQRCINNERKKKQNGMIQSINDGDKNSNFNNNNNNNNINGDSNNNNNNNNYNNNYHNNNCRNNILDQNKCDKNVLCYNNIYKTMKDNDTYIYLKKNKFHSLLKSNCMKTNFNMIKIGYVIFLFLLLCLCIYLITGVECSLFGIYIYLSYFNFNIEGILIDYMDMLNILKLKIKKGYIYPFFVMLPFIFPVIIAMCFFLSVFFLNMYYESFSKLYKKISELKNEFISSTENDNVNERILVSETSNHLYLNESNDKVSNTSDDFLSINNSNISSSKSEMINSNFVFNKLLNSYFSFAVFFSYLGSAFLHISLGEIICIALLTFYQIVKHTNNLNITILLKSEKIKFCKFLLFILYGLVCFSINLYVNQWEEYITKLKRLKRRILLFEKNKFSEIVDLNTQKGDGDDFDETQIFSIFFSFLIKKNEGSKMRDNDMNSESEDSIYDAYEPQIQLHHGNNIVNGMLMMRRISMQNLEDDETQVEYINREMHTQGDLHVRRTNQGILRFNMRRGKKRANEQMGVHHESGNVDDINNVDGTNNMNNMNNVDNMNNMNNVGNMNNMNNINNNDGEEEECVNHVSNYDNNNNAINEDAEEYIKNTSAERAVIIRSEKRIYEKNGNGDIITRNYKNEERYIYLKKWMPFKSMILSKLEKRKRNRKEEYNTPKVLILVHSFLFILILLIFLMVFFKKEPIFRFNMPSVNKRLNNFFKSTNFHEIIPNSVGKCKTKKYIAKEPCFNVGRIYHEEKTFYHATLLFLQGLRSVKIMNMNFYYENGIYYLSLDGYFKHIIGPLFLKLCLGTNFCPISTYAFLVGSKPTFSVNVAVQCNNKKPPYYMTDIIVKDLKITKIEIVKHSDVIDNVDIKLDDVQDRVQEKVNAMLEAKKKIIVWKNQKYHLEGFLNYLISKNALSGFSCEPINY
ncbi:putative membrane protein, partial [Plasmodium reichenowi]